MIGTEAQAHLLAGWLRSRLGREIELEHEAADRLTGVELDGAPTPFPPGDPPNPADLRSRKVAVSMSLFDQKGVKAFEAGPLQATELAATRPNAVPVELQVPLKGLAPGRYICQINVIDEIGRKFAFPRTAMMVQ